jgi:hypothetical protein
MLQGHYTMYSTTGEKRNYFLCFPMILGRHHLVHIMGKGRKNNLGHFEKPI